ncbi:MAG: hypothetical protein OES38_00650 [Gammaproteobacteria bacterium]|nr:hypothetical protein [Gammaproteobacteria bacterium]
MTAINIRGAIIGTVLGILAAVVVIGAAVYFFYCPCALVSGGWLLGPEVTEPVDDWSAANQVELCQIQVSAGLPHSINLNCMAAAGKLYLSCSNCEGKRWSGAALNDPEARMRMAGSVYPVTLTRLTNPERLDNAWLARATKLGVPLDTPRPDGWWSFQVESR